MKVIRKCCLIFIPILLVGCVTLQTNFNPNPWIISAGEKPWVIAHRGARGLFPENTMVAFRESAKLDIQALEMDVHLTKDGIIPDDTNFRAYYQFNEDGDFVYDRSGQNMHATIQGDATRETSTAPVGGGDSESISIFSAGTYTSDVGLDLVFDNNGTNPEGEIIISRINTSPDTIPNFNEALEKYWVVNNYGANQNFTGLESLKFKDLGLFVDMSSPLNLHLFDRQENGFGPLWIDRGTGFEIIETEEAIVYTAPAINQFGQFIIEKSLGLNWIGNEDTDWDNPNNWEGGNIPTAEDHVVIPAGVPFYPVVNIDGISILTLCVELGASLTVPSQFNFDVLME